MEKERVLQDIEIKYKELDTFVHKFQDLQEIEEKATTEGKENFKVSKEILMSQLVELLYSSIRELSFLYDYINTNVPGDKE